MITVSVSSLPDRRPSAPFRCIRPALVWRLFWIVYHRMDTVEKREKKLNRNQIENFVIAYHEESNTRYVVHHFQLRKELSIHSLPQDSEAVMKENRPQKRG